MIIGCVTKLLSYPVVGLDPDYDFGEECYEMPCLQKICHSKFEENSQKVGEDDVN